MTTKRCVIVLLAATLGCSRSSLIDHDFRSGDSAALPMVSDALALSTDSPGAPLATVDQTVAVTGDVYVKWRGEGASIALYYTLDDATFTPIASGVHNAANGGCTLTAGATGCYVWRNGSPTNAYFRVRVVARDEGGRLAAASSNPVNANGMRLLAGNTDPGTDASATSATFFTPPSASKESVSPRSLVVTSSGTVFFRDFYRGVLTVGADGIQRVLVRQSGSTAGDGGLVAGAGLRGAASLALDFNDGLLVFDYDRIRRVDLQTLTIDTLIGGGTSTADGVAPDQVQIAPAIVGAAIAQADLPVLTAVPNGDIYFTSEDHDGASLTTRRLRVYRAASNTVESIVPHGLGDSASASQDITQCAISSYAPVFDSAGAVQEIQALVAHRGASCPGLVNARVRLDPTTGVTSGPHPSAEHTWSSANVSAPSGAALTINRLEGFILTYAASASAWSIAVGNGTNGFCADGTPALACAIDPEDAFVTREGALYFVDGGRIRRVDDAGAVRDVMGRGLAVTEASAFASNLGEIRRIDMWGGGHVVFLDRGAARLRELTPDGVLRTIAGNGVVSSASPSLPATSTGLPLQLLGTVQDGLVADPATGEIYFAALGEAVLSRLRRDTGRWELVAGGGTVPWTSADGQPGAQIDLSGGFRWPAGLHNGQLLVGEDGSWQGDDTFYKLYATSDGTQSQLVGRVGAPVSSFCADGVVTASCTSPYSGIEVRATYDEQGGRWLILEQAARQVRTFAGGQIGTLLPTPLASTPSSFAYRRNASLTQHVLYYCDAGAGRLHAFDLVAGQESALPWRISAMECVGSALLYDPGRGTLVFPYRLNGLYGVAEYPVP